MVKKFPSYVKPVLTVVILSFMAYRLVHDNDRAVKHGAAFQLDHVHPNYVHYVNLAQLSQNTAAPKEESLNDFKKYYKQLVRIMPNKSEAYGMLGYLDYHLGNQEAAIDQYQRAIEINPHFFWFFHNLGILYYQNEQYADAVKMFQQALDKDKKFALQFITLSKKVYMPLIYRKHPKCSGPECRLEPAEKIQLVLKSKSHLDQAYEDCIALLASSYLKMGNYKNVFRLLDKADGLGYHRENFYYYAGIAAYETKDYDQSNNLLLIHLKNNPNHADGYLYLGRSLKAMNQEDASSKALRKGNLLRDKNQGNTVLIDKPLRLASF